MIAETEEIKIRLYQVRAVQKVYHHSPILPTRLDAPTTSTRNDKSSPGIEYSLQMTAATRLRAGRYSGSQNTRPTIRLPYRSAMTEVVKRSLLRSSSNIGRLVGRSPSSIFRELSTRAETRYVQDPWFDYQSRSQQVSSSWRHISS